MAKEIDLGIDGIGPATMLARGGSAYVYLAEQVDFGRQVAVKVLFNALEDDATYGRFDRECRAIGAVSNHPNIVVVHGRGLTADERPYLIMEHRAGGSLAQVLATRGRLTEAEVVRIGIKIAKALEVAHAAGVLHRDVKPGNILLSSYNEPALADFGIARIDGAHKTTEGVLTASVVHASREVLASGEPTPQSDVYSLGSTLFELATGRAAYSRPEDRSMWAVINRVLAEDLPDPTKAGVSPALASVLTKAMSHNPEHRHQRAADLAADLERLGSGTGMAVGPTVAAADPGGPTNGVGTEIDRQANRGVAAGVGSGVGDKPTDMMPEVKRPDGRPGRPGESSAVPDHRAQSPQPTGRNPKSGDPSVSISRSGVVLSVATILVATLAVTGVALQRTTGSTGGGPDDTSTPTIDRSAPEALFSPASSLAADGQPSDGDDADDGDGSTRAVSNDDAVSDGGEGEEPGTAGPPGPPEPLVLNFRRAEVGPLRTGEPYVVQVDGGLEEANYRIVIDNQPVTAARATPPPFFPEAGRHQLQVQAITDTRVQLSNTVEIYVAHIAPASGYRANLSSIRSEPENWPEALRQLDQMVLDGHENLKLSVSNRTEANQLRPYWNYYVDGFGDDQAMAQQYCDERGLDRDQCYVARVAE